MSHSAEPSADVNVRDHDILLLAVLMQHLWIFSTNYKEIFPKLYAERVKHTTYRRFSGLVILWSSLRGLCTCCIVHTRLYPQVNHFPIFVVSPLACPRFS